MIKLYEEYVETAEDYKFRYKMQCIDKINNFVLGYLMTFFEELDLKYFSFEPKSTSNYTHEIYFYKHGKSTNQYLCFYVSLTLTTSMSTGTHHVNVEMKPGNFSFHYEEYMTYSLNILEFLAQAIDSNVNYDDQDFEFFENISIEDLDKIKSKITVENYNIWLDSKKYNL